VSGQDKAGTPAGVTHLLSPDAPQQLHFVQYGGLLQLSRLQLQGRAGNADGGGGGGGGGGGVLINSSRDGTEDHQPAAFAARLVTFK
jgi:hypothetical protein